MDSYSPFEESFKHYREPTDNEQALEKRINLWLVKNKIFSSDGKAPISINEKVNRIVIKRKPSEIFEKRKISPLNFIIKLDSSNPNTN